MYGVDFLVPNHEENVKKLASHDVILRYFHELDSLVETASFSMVEAFQQFFYPLRKA